MKVLKKGRKQRGWTEEFICTGNGNGEGGCGAKLLVEQNDVFQTAHHRFDGSSDYYNTFICAACKVPTDIPSVPFTPRDMTVKEKRIVQKLPPLPET